MLRIALLGTRGVPANYSGFETCVEQLGKRLVERGHEVTVYCRPHHIDFDGDEYEGMRLVKLPTVANKYTDTLVHSFLSSVHALKERYDIALYFIVGNAAVSWIPRLAGTKTLINVDGLDWKRDKWNAFAKRYLQFSEYLATKLPHVHLTDNRVVQGYYKDRYNTVPPFIPYGSEVEHTPPGEVLDRFGLEPDQYVLFVGRLVPENCAHHLVEAFKGLDTDLKCVIVGDAPYAEDYQRELRALAGDDPRIVFTGYVFGEGYHELGSNARLFVETSKASGTHPALIEGMAFGNCVISYNTAENLETMGDAGFAYEGEVGADSLRALLQQLLADPALLAEYRGKAQARAQAKYSWEAVTDDYERLFFKTLGQPTPERLLAPRPEVSLPLEASSLAK